MNKRDIFTKFMGRSGILTLPRILPVTHLTIIAYHRVVRTENYRWNDGLISATPEEFEMQVAHIADRYSPITFRTLHEALTGNCPMPPNPVILTFDDGYRDCYTEIFPTLMRHGVRGVFYITTGFINEKCVPWWDKEAFIEKYGRLPDSYPDFMSWDQIIEMHNCGMEIGGHTVSHVSAFRESRVSLEREVFESKSELESKLGTEIISFAYPHGDWTEEAVEIVDGSGYQYAVTLDHGINRIDNCLSQRLKLKRIAVELFDDFDSFRSKIRFPRLVRY